MGMRTPIQAPANPGNAGTATLYDSKESESDALKSKRASRVRVAIFLTGQNATIKHEWEAPGSANLRTCNGGGSGETVTASTYFQRDFLLQPGRNLITLVNGATAPTLYEVGIEVIDDQAVGQ